MFSMKIMFAICMSLVLVSTLISFVSTRIVFDLWVAVAISIVVSAMGSTSIIYLERKRIGFKMFVKNVPVENEDELLKFLQIAKIIPREDHVLVQDSSNRLIGHAYLRITDVPYLIDDLDREKKLYYVGNFVRILSTLNFLLEIIPRIMPVSTEALLKRVRKEMEDLQIILSSEGATPNPSRKARMRQLERISERILKGERARDVSFLAHVLVEGKEEENVLRELEANVKTMVSALESGLGIKVERLRGSQMLEAIQEFFRATPIIEPSKTFRMLSWDLAYLIPLVKPKLPPIEKLLTGVYLGRTSGGAVVCLDLKKYANPHVMILGKSGYGKSTTLKTLVSRLFDLYEIPVLIIDYAGEYKEWVLDRGGLVVDMRKDTINPFELGHATLIDRIRQIVDAFHKTCDFKTINQKNAFTHYVMKAYQAKGFKLNEPQTWKEPPTLADVIKLMENEMEKLKPNKQLTVQSLIDRLQVLSSGPFGIFGKSTISIDQLTEGFTCVDLSKLTSNSLKDMIAWTILQYIDSMMRLEGVKERIRLLIALDEAWKLCRDEDSLPVTIIKEGRKYGYSLCISSQDATADLAESILANAGTVIIHHTEHPKYLKFFQSAYGLTEWEVSKIKNLPVGEALIKLGDDPRPFFVSIEMEDLPEKIHQKSNRISYEKIGDRMAFSENLGKIMHDFVSDSYELTEVEREILRKVAEEAIFSMSDLYRKVGVNDYQGNKAKNKLVQKGLVETIKLPKLEGKGRKPEALVLTEKGVAEAEKLGLKTKRKVGRRGGILHQYIVKILSEEIRQRGCKVEAEFSIGNGRSVDLVIDERIAIEVETGESDIVSNIKKIAEAKFEKSLIVCESSSVKNFVKKNIRSLGREGEIIVLDLSELPKLRSLLKEAEPKESY